MGEEIMENEEKDEPRDFPLFGASGTFRLSDFQMSAIERTRMIGWAWAGIKWLFVLGLFAAIIVIMVAVGRARGHAPKSPPPKVNAIVTLYDGGKEIEQWTTEDFDAAPNTLWFTDKATGNRIRLNGTFTVIVPKKKETK